MIVPHVLGCCEDGRHTSRRDMRYERIVDDIDLVIPIRKRVEERGEKKKSGNYQDKRQRGFAFRAEEFWK